MINTVIGFKEDLDTYNLKIDEDKLEFVLPENFSTINAVNEIIIFNFKRLTDKDIPILNNIPFLIVINSLEDLIHLKMHLDDKRLVLTPYDYIYLNENLRDYVMNFDFLKPFLTKTIKNEKIIELKSFSNLKYEVKEEFSNIPKSVWVSMNYKMRDLNYFPFYPVVAAPDYLRKTLSTIFPVTKIVNADTTKQPPDLLLLDISSIKNYLEIYKSINGIILLCFVNPKNTIEYFYKVISSYLFAPINLNDLKFIGPLHDGSLLVALIIEINR